MLELLELVLELVELEVLELEDDVLELVELEVLELVELEVLDDVDDEVELVVVDEDTNKLVTFPAACFLTSSILI